MQRYIRILSLFFVVAFVASVSDISPAFAANKNFLVENGVLVMYLGSDIDLSIPDNLGIKEIGDNAFRGNNHISDVIIPDGIEKIGNNAFFNCSNLKTIRMPDSVKSIGIGAFSYCSSLSSVTLSKGLTYVGPAAFFATAISDPIIVNGGQILCYVPADIKAYTIPYTVREISGAFYRCTQLASVKMNDGLSKIDSYSFSECTSLTSVTIPQSVSYIGGNAFTGCKELRAVTIPDKITEICESTFSDCVQLSSVVIPAGVTSIGNYAFYGCENLKSITIPKGVSSIGTCVFSGTSIPNPVLIDDGKALCYVPTQYMAYDIPNSVTQIVGGAFSGCALRSIVIPFGINSIGDYAFSGCDELKNVTVPDSVTSIGEGAFSYCESLEEIVLSKKIISIEDKTFMDCMSLMDIEIPRGVRTIGDSAFEHCSSLTAVSVPDGVISIGPFAFMFCGKLKSLSIPSSVVYINSLAVNDRNIVFTVESGSYAEQFAQDQGYTCTVVDSDRFAVPTKSAVIIDGRPISVEAYNINDNNYFKLRDLASLLSGTQKSFEVSWNEKDNAIMITKGKPYTPVGGELMVSPNMDGKTALLAYPKMFLDGRSISIRAYDIGGYNYFKLRDIAEMINFGISWDGVTNVIGIDTAAGYTL